MKILLRVFAGSAALSLAVIALPAMHGFRSAPPEGIAVATLHDEARAASSSGVMPAAPLEVHPAAAAKSFAKPSALSATSGTGSSGGTAAPLHALTRALERDGTLDLLVPDVDKSLGRLRATVARFGGDFLDLEDERPDSNSDPRTLSAKIVVPQASFDRAMDALASLGGVKARTATAQDVGDQLVDDAARLRNLRRTEHDLLAIMDRSGKVSEVLDVENQLANVRDEIERLDAERTALVQKVDDATITLTMTAESAQQQPAEPGIATQLGAAWRSARHAAGVFAVGLAENAIYLLVFVPFWLGGALALTALFFLGRKLVRRIFRRGVRESALPAAT